MVRLALLLAVLLLTASWFFLLRPPVFRVIFFNVGQGQSILIESPAGFQILVDGGPSSQIVSFLGEALPFYDHHLDAIILTHSDRDHLYGLLELFRRYSVDQLFLPEFLGESETVRLFRQRLARLPSLQVIEATAQSDFEKAGLKIDFLAPRKEWSTAGLAENDLGLVFALRYQALDLLFMGDASSELETRLLKELPDVEVLQVGHHGSNTSTSASFLQRITPRLAIISVGPNSYGHPRPEVLERLKAVGAHILRTDQLGHILLFLRDNQIRVKTRPV